MLEDDMGNLKNDSGDSDVDKEKEDYKTKKTDIVKSLHNIMKDKKLTDWKALAEVHKLRLKVHKSKAKEIGDHESSDMSESDSASSSSDLEEHEILQNSII